MGKRSTAVFKGFHGRSNVGEQQRLRDTTDATKQIAVEAFRAEVDATLAFLVRAYFVTLATSMFVGVAVVVFTNLAGGDFSELGYIAPDSKSLGSAFEESSQPPHALVAGIVVPLYLATQISQQPDPRDARGHVLTYVLDSATSVAAIIASTWSACALFQGIAVHGHYDIFALAGWFFYPLLAILSARQTTPTHVALLEASIDNVQRSQHSLRANLRAPKCLILTEGRVRVLGTARFKKIVRRLWLRRMVGWCVWAAVQLAVQAALAAGLQKVLGMPWSFLTIVPLIQGVFGTFGPLLCLDVRHAKVARLIVERVVSVCMLFALLAFEVVVLLSLILEALDDSPAVIAWSLLLASLSSAFVVVSIFWIVPRSRTGKLYLHNRLVRTLVLERGRLERAKEALDSAREGALSGHRP